MHLCILPYILEKEAIKQVKWEPSSVMLSNGIFYSLRYWRMQQSSAIKPKFSNATISDTAV